MAELATLTELDTVEVSLVKRGANNKRVALTKEDIMEPETKVEETPVVEVVQEQSSVEKVEEPVSVEKVETAPEPSAELVALQKAVEEERTARLAVEAELKKERDDRAMRELVAKVQVELSNIPGTAEATANLVKKAGDAGFGSEFEALLKTVNVQLGQSALFAIKGSNQPVEEAKSVIDSKIAKMREAHPSLSYEQAYVRIIKADPQLKLRVLEEVK